MSKLRGFNTVHGLILTVLNPDGTAGYTIGTVGLPGEPPDHVRDAWFGTAPSTAEELLEDPAWDYGTTCLDMDPVIVEAPELPGKLTIDGELVDITTKGVDRIDKYRVRLYNVPLDAFADLLDGRDLSHGVAVETWTPAPAHITDALVGPERRLAASVLPRLAMVQVKVVQRRTGRCYDLVGVTRRNPAYASLCYPQVELDKAHRIFGLIAEEPDPEIRRLTRPKP